MSRIITAAIAITAIAFPASATAASADAWRAASTNAEGETVMIASGSESEHGSFFSCANETLGVGVATEPGDIVEMLSRETSRSNDREISARVGDGEEFISRWTYLPSLKVAVAADELTAKKLYNAAVKGETVSWKMPGRDALEIQFPEMNDAFKAFANDCVVTNPSKKS